MKSSISKNSGNKVLTRTVAGLIFYPQVVTKSHYLSVLDWVEAGKPNGAYIFDNADTLKVCGIPICDGAPLRGLYRRIPALKPREAKITLVAHLIRKMTQGVAKSTHKGVLVAETKAHHTMSYS